VGHVSLSFYDNTHIRQLQVSILGLILQLWVDLEKLAQVQLMLGDCQQQCQLHIWKVGCKRPTMKVGNQGGAHSALMGWGCYEALVGHLE